MSSALAAWIRWQVAPFAADRFVLIRKIAASEPGVDLTLPSRGSTAESGVDSGHTRQWTQVT